MPISAKAQATMRSYSSSSARQMSRPDFTPVTRDRSSSPFGALHKKGVAVGAHPSFDDRENFGRKEIRVPSPQLFTQLVYQIGAFYSLALAAGTRARHVKPHGALYNMAVRDQEMAEAIAHAILTVDSALILFAPANSAMERAGEKARLQVAREIFADRNYLNDGWLVPRTRPDALLRDPKEAAERVLRMLREGKGALGRRPRRRGARRNDLRAWRYARRS